MKGQAENVLTRAEHPQRIIQEQKLDAGLHELHGRQMNMPHKLGVHDDLTCLRQQVPTKQSNVRSLDRCPLSPRGTCYPAWKALGE